MKKEILVQSSIDGTEVAVLEDDILVEIYIEKNIGDRLVGSIFKGQIENVLPGMQAAFVNIGQEKNAFLYVEDAISDNTYGKGGVKPNIRDILKEGQEVVVQVSKEPIGTKGARVTRQLTLPGRFLVLMPTVDYIGISRRIREEEERDRLKDIAEEIRTGNIGMIIRTVAEGATKEQLEEDFNFLVSVWEKIKVRIAMDGAPRIIHQDLQLVERILRDVVTDDVDKITFNNTFNKEKIKNFIGDEFSSQKIVLSEKADLFSQYNIRQEIASALKRKVWLKNGGYIIIDQTEALTSIDVNTGKFVGSIDLEDTVLRTNIEATYEIAKQLRIRNIGGIIIIDFIDMIDEEHQEAVISKLEEHLSHDKTKANILGITNLGLLEMTRKKVRHSLSSVFEMTCPCCEGKGRIFSEETISNKIKEELREKSQMTMADVLRVKAHPKVISFLIGPGETNLKELEDKLNKRIILKAQEDCFLNNYQIDIVHNQEEILTDYVPVEESQLIKVTIEEKHSKNKNNGIARISGYVIDVENASKHVGKEILVEITKVFKTYAKAIILN